ncbi:MAG: hypothetical protein KJ058_08565 [Thermoanaerobaculia bacterium]|nr:hypothetical protein [Thermoanaerobaculia bacterium]MCZ7652917.1 hypothetical protein [Thermoanaerobaculia bacterium]
MPREGLGLWPPMLLVIGANVLYHWAQRSVPREVPAAASLAVAYAVALAATLVVAPWTGAAGGGSWASALNPWSLLVGVAIVGVEFGFLLAYRAGWPLHSAALFASAALAVLLVPMGAFLLGEPWDLRRTAGLLLCLAGLWLLQRP